MTKPLWAPWRLEYIQQAGESTGCVFCDEAAGSLDPAESLLLARGEHAIALLNKYPYASGHLMVSPVRHVGEVGDLSDEEALAIHRLAVEAVATLNAVYGPAGFNLGWNLGHSAGAGIADHVHEHVVPRWSGDTNFMPVLAEVKVLPEHLLVSRDRLREAWVSR
jgi:ATP adenylyltransferase